jgi:uncharacterized 2Fe-2S/4Fe-4S cluster protein (DUF4445 family)
LRDVLFEEGVEFPCGGQGRCKGCKIKLLAGSLPFSDEERTVLSEGELAQGYRLACRGRAEADIKLELAQWEAAVLVDDSVFEFQSKEGWGIAIDIGTTTLAGQLLDLKTGQVLAVRTALNAQSVHGADIMSRVEFAVAARGLRTLQTLIRKQIGNLVQELIEASTAAIHNVRSPLIPGGAGVSPATTSEHVKLTDEAPTIYDVSYQQDTRALLKNIVLVGNTVMHHLFCGLDLEPLSHYPFEAISPEMRSFSPAELDWELPREPTIRFLPCLGGFVGSDILAGILATRLHESEALSALIDLGTNGEMVLGNQKRLLCASTAAGPAFEGARISMGMRAATGAISEVRVRDGQLECNVLGKSSPRGICGSGLVDAVAVGLELARVKPTGRLTQGDSLALAAPVLLTQHDIRELQLAKGAIAAGLRILLKQWGATAADVEQVYLAGAFGNYINQTSARRIGLLDFPTEKIKAAGNTALLGAKLALFSLPEHDVSCPEIMAKTRHVSLHEDPSFQDVYVEEMSFPPA